MKLRRYSELIQRQTFEDRFAYLRIGGRVGETTFGSERFLNQNFYHSPEWRRVRSKVIVRDSGCDLAVLDRPIGERIYIHHINPLLVEDFDSQPELLLNPEYLVCCSFETHQALHYGYAPPIPSKFEERFQYDTCPWKQ